MSIFLWGIASILFLENWVAAELHNMHFKSFSKALTKEKNQRAFLLKVYTATKIEGINYVNIELENREYPIIIGGEGIVIDKPLSSNDYKEYR